MLERAILNLDMKSQMPKNLIEFEGKTYWLNLIGMETGDDNEIEFSEVMPDGTLVPVSKNGTDLFEVMEAGHIVGDSLPNK